MSIQYEYTVSMSIRLNWDTPARPGAAVACPEMATPSLSLTRVSICRFDTRCRHPACRSRSRTWTLLSLPSLWPGRAYPHLLVPPPNSMEVPLHYEEQNLILNLYRRCGQAAASIDFPTSATVRWVTASSQPDIPKLHIGTPYVIGKLRMTILPAWLNKCCDCLACMTTLIHDLTS